MLLVGNPGVSKSQVLLRGVYASGKGSSAVSLTAYVICGPETKQLVLEVLYHFLLVVHYC